MPLVYACIAPHGDEIVPRLAGSDVALFSPTRKGMRSLASELSDARPETLVIASPHNLRLRGHIGVVMSENSSGCVSRASKKLALKARCDQKLAADILAEAEKRGVPVIGANYGSASGPPSNLPMDWGTLIPLSFFLGKGRFRRRIVIVTPSREISLDQNYEFGRVVAEVSERTSKRIAFVASADQAHAHRKSGPYGYSKEAARYDTTVVEAVRGNRLRVIMGFTPAFVEAAKPDSLWQMSMLVGVLDVAPMVPKVHSYQVPTYYGMLCAGYTRVSRV
jgi:aromatic ring-opening dioxygenase LigB subunit